MVLETTTLVDRVPPSTSARTCRRRNANWRRIFADFCFVLVELSGFAASTLLLTLGLPWFLYFAFMGWDLELLFMQLGNLAEHYAAAGPSAQSIFSLDLQIAFLVVAGGLGLLRLPGFLVRLDRGLTDWRKNYA